MYKLIFSLSLISTINFSKTNHPLSMGLNLLIQTILISTICGMMFSTYWYNYIMFLIMIGGMLVLFIYVTSLASNELFNFSMNSLIMYMLLLISFNLMLIFNDQYLMLISNLETIIFNKMNMLNYENNIDLIKLYNNSTMNITIMMIMYLLMTLIIIIKITNINYGPLRQLN
uniref:NADH-ubiquinone oxidoreductase chain 6 n=1 Tax=Ditaxis biseriata TaxID=560959 RepID=C8YXH9_DITBI|nr:NADH dehydrogenase subunit 6 [Ditaxis biseriata]ACO92613.1 NADH dehydrogenase subunit 6 [Ditaxis biseriata]